MAKKDKRQLALKDKRQKTKACHVKCDACPVKFEVRKYFSGEGAYFTMDKSEEKKIQQSPDANLLYCNNGLPSALADGNNV